MNTIFWLHLFSCWFMTGAIFLVQVLIYPFFKFVGEKEFSKLHQFHMKKITFVVAPMMVLELTTAIGLFYGSSNQLFFWNLVSVVALWMLTAFVNVPTHNNLTFDSVVSKRNLVQRNWPRTMIWSLRSVFLFYLILSQPLQEVL